MYILTEGRNINTFLKKTLKEKMYWKKIVVTYLLKDVEHGIEHDVDSAYGACIH